MLPHYILWLAISAMAVVMDDQPYCALRYRRLCQGKGRHIACQFPNTGPGESCENYTEIKFNTDLRHFITHYINRRRQRLAAGYERVRGGAQLPRPAVMMQVEWDRELATLAQRLADQCTFVHDDCRATVRYPYAGQTVGEVKWRRLSESEELSAQRAIRRVLDAWWGERRRVTPRQLTAPFRLTAKGTVWGHFSQLSVWTLRAVGCGAVRHSIGYPRVLLVCDFSHTNMLGQRTISPGPLAPCPTHTARKRRSSYPLLCAPVRHQAHTTTVDYNQEDNYDVYDDEEGEANSTFTPEPNAEKDIDTTSVIVDITWMDSTRQDISWSTYSTKKYTTRLTTWKDTATWPTTKRRTTREETTRRKTTWKNIPSFIMRTGTYKDPYAKTFVIGLQDRQHKDEEYDPLVIEERKLGTLRRPEQGRLVDQLGQELNPQDESEQAKDPHWIPAALPRRPNFGRFRENKEILQISGLDDKPRKGWVHSIPADDDPKAERNWLPSRKNEDSEDNAMGYYRSRTDPDGVQVYEPRQRWQQTRDRPKRPGANALLLNTLSTKTFRRRPEKLSKASLKMDKDIEDQLFQDTGFHPNWKPKNKKT